MDKKYIIVAEDDEFFASVFSMKLTKAGYEVAVAKNGNECLELAKKRKPDLFLLDLIMPGKDGFDTLSDIKKDSDLKSVKVMIMSSLEQKEDIEKAKSLGADEFAVKSDLDTVSSQVEKVLGK